MSSPASPDRLHPIRVVVKRTGLSADVLRVWERRYQAVSPQRTDGDRRLYSDEDIERLLLLRRATDAGRSIGQVASLPTTELRSVVGTDEAAGLAAPPTRIVRAQPGARAERPRDAAEASVLLAQALAAVHALQPQALEDVLQQGRLALAPAVVLERVIVPLLHRIGDEWRDGSLRIAHEHLASAVLRGFLATMADGLRPPEDAPVLLVATPAGQQHELGAMMAATTAASEGWRVVYIGANLPADEIAVAARQCSARAVALSIVHPHDDPRLPQELRRMRRALPDGLPLLAGGSAAASYGPALRESAITVLGSLPDLRRALERARAGG